MTVSIDWQKKKKCCIVSAYLWHRPWQSNQRSRAEQRFDATSLRHHQWSDTDQSIPTDRRLSLIASKQNARCADHQHWPLGLTTIRLLPPTCSSSCSNQMHCAHRTTARKSPASIYCPFANWFLIRSTGTAVRHSFDYIGNQFDLYWKAAFVRMQWKVIVVWFAIASLLIVSNVFFY